MDIPERLRAPSNCINMHAILRAALSQEAQNRIENTDLLRGTARSAYACRAHPLNTTYGASPTLD
ncbi:hypothetical protein OH77DRAFT_1419916 [Trametes cingulata]|nr:hypothetical protein OH77DRAFT_1419916 [Trametes cingulata]